MFCCRADVTSSQRWSWICADFLLPSSPESWVAEVHVRQISIFENEFTCVVTPIHLKIRSNLISSFWIFASLNCFAYRIKTLHHQIITKSYLSCQSWITLQTLKSEKRSKFSLIGVASGGPLWPHSWFLYQIERARTSESFKRFVVNLEYFQIFLCSVFSLSKL